MLTGCLKATALTLALHQPCRWLTPSLLLRLSPWLHTMGGGSIRWRCDDNDDDGGGGCHSLSLGLLLLHQAQHPLLMTSVTYPGETLARWEKHATGIRRTRLTVCVLPRARLCMADMSVLFAHFINTRQVIFFQLNQGQPGSWLNNINNRIDLNEVLMSNQIELTSTLNQIHNF